MARDADTLNCVPIGQPVRIVSIEGDHANVRRIMEMGLLEGEEVKVVGSGPFGDPLDLQLSTYHLSLRKKEAAQVRVEPVGESP